MPLEKKGTLGIQNLGLDASGGSSSLLACPAAATEHGEWLTRILSLGVDATPGRTSVDNETCRHLLECKRKKLKVGACEQPLR